jgi:hypothetical protein
MQPRELGIRWRRVKALTLSVDTRLERPPAVPQCASTQSAGGRRRRFPLGKSWSGSSWTADVRDEIAGSGCVAFSRLVRTRGPVIARQDPPSGISPEEAVAEVRDVLDSLGDACPECLPADCACCDRQTTGDCDGMFFLKVREVGRILEQVLATSNPRRTIMPIQIVMDRSGDRRHPFNSDDAQELAKAEQRFYELTNAGFTAAVRTGPGQTSHLRSFDPTAEETVFFPRLVGG